MVGGNLIQSECTVLWRWWSVFASCGLLSGTYHEPHVNRAITYSAIRYSGSAIHCRWYRRIQKWYSTWYLVEIGCQLSREMSDWSEIWVPSRSFNKRSHSNKESSHFQVILVVQLRDIHLAFGLESGSEVYLLPSYPLTTTSGSSCEECGVRIQSLEIHHVSIFHTEKKLEELVQD